MKGSTVTAIAAESVIPEWRKDGLHWHAYREEHLEVPPIPSVVGAGRPVAVLCTPHAVSGWMGHTLSRTPTGVLLWAAGERRWVSIGNGLELARLRLEVLLHAAWGESVHLSVSTPTSACLSLHAEAVTHGDCEQHAWFSDSLVEHCRGEAR
jgi:hypothetical protein